MNAIQITWQAEDVPADEPALESLVRTICERFGVSGATIGVAIVDDARIGELNQRFLGHEGPTDCLSFDLSDGDARVFDLVVNGQMAVREAARRGHPGRAELALYVTHGLLHQLGFDDAEPEQARRMHEMEDEILQHAGFGVVYNDRSPL
ncbi:rRNA maturation RNase YbeY [Anaerobaca lacustris]|uniref:Endoribonuclease YbeY n=1 Tax=Anaerobaca lacustris TaxID=3044600 RepID=A0AAW6TYI0_9BACT|nr:rRNA maturation RNase YbeY [Sedimentisphaerales bacterium M17dextr]